MKNITSIARYLKLGAGVAALSLLASGLHAQTVKSALDGLTPKGLEPGSPAGTYALSGFDSMNLYNGMINFSIPLLTVPSRGESGYTMRLPVSQIWNAKSELICRLEGGDCSDDQCDPEGVSGPDCFWQTTFSHDWWGGMDFAYNAGVMYARTAATGAATPCHTNGLPGSTPFFYYYPSSLTRLTLKLPDGSETEFRDTGTNGAVETQPSVDCETAQGWDRGRVWVAVDGSATTFISQDDIYDIPRPDQGFHIISGTIFFRNGVKYHVNQSVVDTITDRNGNQTTLQWPDPNSPGIGNLTIHDSLGHTITVSRDLSWDDGIPDGTNHYHGQTYDDIKFSGAGNAERHILIYRRPFQYDMGCASPPCSDGQPFSSVLNGGLVMSAPSISAVELPNGQKYQFIYDDFGEVKRVVLPTGGVYEYTWVNGAGNSPLIFKNVQQVAVYRRVTTRVERPSADLNAPVTRTTQYTAQVLQNHLDTEDPLGETSESHRCAISYCTEVTVTESGNGPLSGSDVLAASDHYFYGSTIDTAGDPIDESLFPLPTQFSAWNEGREFRTVTKSASGTALEDQHQTWVNRTNPLGWNETLSGPIPAIDARLLQSTDSVTGESTLYGYPSDSSDNSNNVISVQESDASGVLRVTHTDYVTDSSYFTSFSNPGPHLRSLPLHKVICAATPCDTSDSFAARTDYVYDNAALTPRSGASGYLDPGAGTMRGNLTSVSVWTTTTESDKLTTAFTYDVLGNVVSATDPTGSNTTTIGYTDGDGCGSPVGGGSTFAFATSITNPLSWTSHYCYDYYLGRAISSSDANAVPSTIGYGNQGSDLLDRPSDGDVAVGMTGLERKTSVRYTDTPNALQIETQSDRVALGDAATAGLDSSTYYDGFGRVIKTSRRVDQNNEDGHNAVVVETTYDGLGRKLTVSSPHYSNEPAVQTTYSYDALNRPTSVQNPDNSAIVTNYTQSSSPSQIQEEITDEANHSRTSTKDVLGRLISVVEDPGGHAYLTSYQYDVLGNLTGVCQGGSFSSGTCTSSGDVQTRSFTYDMASRLLTAVNPESGTTTYVYDKNGNVYTKSDARYTRTYGYDALNRQTSIAYTPASGSGLPAVATKYFCYDAQAASATGCTATASTTMRGPQTGTWSADASSTAVADPLGRITSSTQTLTTPGTSRAFSYTYNLDGTMNTEQYPSGTVAWDYDLGGRPVTAGLGSAGATDYASHVKYAAQDAVQSLTLGNGVTETWEFNNRLQPTLLTIGAPGGASNLLSLEWSYVPVDHSVNDNGNVWSQSIITGTKNFNQTYNYDALNRLTSVYESVGLTPSWNESFDHDQFGNHWISASSVIVPNLASPTSGGAFNKANNRIVADTYDGAGNLQSDSNVGAMTYDEENHMLTFVSGGVTTSYSYDASGRRVKKIGSSTTTEYVYDATGQLAAEYSTPSALPPCGPRCFLSVDSLGSTRLVTNQNGAAMARHDYLPFGEEIPSSLAGRQTILDNSVATYDAVADLGNPSADSPVRFTGKQRDAESGLDYFGARYMSSAQGRFTSPDKPFADQHSEDPQSWNLYAYVRNNPLRLVDDTGEGAREKLQGVWQGAQNWFNNTMAGFMETAVAPDQMISDTWNGLKGLAQTAFTSQGREALANRWNDMSEQEKAALVTEGTLTVAGAVVTRGEGESGFAASAAESFGFKSFGVSGSVVGGELAGGGSALVSFSKSAESFGVNISMVNGPAGTLSKLETGAINAAKSQGASTLELRATMVKDSMGRLLRKSGFTQEFKDGNATSNWVKKIKLNDQDQ